MNIVSYWPVFLSFCLYFHPKTYNLRCVFLLYKVFYSTLLCLPSCIEFPTKSHPLYLSWPLAQACVRIRKDSGCSSKSLEGIKLTPVFRSAIFSYSLFLLPSSCIMCWDSFQFLFIFNTQPPCKSCCEITGKTGEICWLLLKALV